MNFYPREMVPILMTLYKEPDVMLITVIIPFRNASATLQNCLNTLLSQSYTSAEFILVDNNSSDNSREIARQFLNSHPCFPMKLISEDTLGASAARNRGAQESTGDWLVFTDSDCMPDSNWLKDFTGHIEGGEPTIGAIAGCIFPSATKSIIGRFLGLFTLPANTQQRILKSYTLVDGGFPTANFAIRKSLFNQIGGFDETIQIYGEDHDLCIKVYTAGQVIKAITNAIVRHIHREHVMPLIKQAYGFGTAHALLMRKLSSGCFIIQTPFGETKHFGGHYRLWCDFNQADKKILAAILASVIWPPLLILPFSYLVYLSLHILKLDKQRNVSGNILSAMIMTFLLILKSAALTFGRLRGSFRHRVICL